MPDTHADGANGKSPRLGHAGGGRAHHRLSHRRLVVIMTALMLCLLLQALDQTMVALAMPRIVGSLHGFDLYAWVVTSYVLGSTVLLPIAGRLSDQFGRKHFVLGGVVMFLIGSALAGQADDMRHLVFYRARCTASPPLPARRSAVGSRIMGRWSPTSSPTRRAGAGCSTSICRSG
jgi:MFS family permease